jgi:hypothetical protein
VFELDLDLRDRRVEHAQGLIEQFLARLIPFEHDNPGVRHAR